MSRVRLQGRSKPTGQNRVLSSFACRSAQLVHETWNQQRVSTQTALLETGDDSELRASLMKAHVDTLRRHCMPAGPQGRSRPWHRAGGRWQAPDSPGRRGGLAEMDSMVVAMSARSRTAVLINSAVL